MENRNSRNVPAALVYNGEIISAKSEMLSLTDMWRAASAPENRGPYEWSRKEGAAFIEAVALSHNTPEGRIMTTKRGKGGATFAHWQIALAYAKYLSPEFHMWCNTVVRERMEGNSVSASALPADVLELIRRTDGIARQLSHKVTEIEKAIPAIVGRQIEAAIIADSRRAALNVVSVRQLTEDGGALKKGRNSVNRRIGSALRDLAAADQDGGKALKCPHTGVWLFDRAFAERFMRDFGGAMIRAHNDRAGGQGALKLVQPKKADLHIS